MSHAAPPNRAIEHQALRALRYVIAVVGPDGNLTELGEGFDELLGVSAEVAVGRRGFGVFHPADLEALAEGFAYVGGSSGPYGPMIYRMRHADGRFIPIEFNVVGRDPLAQDHVVLALRRVDEQVVNDEPVRLLAEGQPLPDILEALAQAMAVGVVGLPATVLWERQDGRYTAAAHSNGTHGLDEALDEVLLSASDRPVLWDDYRADAGEPGSYTVERLPEPVRSAAVALGVQRVWLVPIGPGLPVATLALWDCEDRPRIRPGVRVRLRRIGALAALAFEREHYEQQLLHAAAHDPLTGLLNRARFFGVLERQARRSPVAVIFVDLDHFKPVNDEYGHHIGDEVLVEVARRLEDAMRPTDILARLGGDEFAVLCAEAPDDEALARIAQRLLDSLEEPIQTAAGPIAIGASLGLARAQPNAAPDQVVEAADRAMLEGKRRGRGGALLGDRLIATAN